MAATSREHRPDDGSGTHDGTLARKFDERVVAALPIARSGIQRLPGGAQLVAMVRGPGQRIIQFAFVKLAGKNGQVVNGDQGFPAIGHAQMEMRRRLVIGTHQQSAATATTHTGKITLEAGRKYDIRMEYYENAGVASAMLGWSSRSQAWEIVPKSQLFASNSTPPVQQPSPGVDLAAGKKAVASSVQNNKTERLNYLTDSDDTTRWASQLGSDNEWIYVDLGDVYSIDRVRLNWETAFAKTYEIQVSNDGQTWTTVYRTSNGDGKIDDLTGLSASGRYVKMLGLERGFPAGFSLWSMEVYGVN